MSTSSDGRAQRGESTRSALLVAARQRFCNGGFAGTSVRDIAETAGVHTALVTYHFGTKRKLWEQVVSHAMGSLVAAIGARVNVDSDPSTLARNALSAYLDHLDEAPDFPRLIVRAVLDGDPIVLDVARTHLRPLVASSTALSTLPDAEQWLLTIFGATVVPYLYREMLTEAFATDPLSESHAERRRHHLMQLVELALQETP